MATAHEHEKSQKRLEKLHLSLEILQSLFLIGAMIVGGIWTFYIFQALDQSEAAKISLEKSQAEIRELEKRLREQPVLETNLHIEQPALPRCSGKFLSVTAEIKNVGSGRATLQFNNLVPLEVVRLTFDDAGNVSATKTFQTTGPTSPIKSYLGVGATKNIPFFLRVDEAGVYLVTFQVDANRDELGDLKDLPPGNATWTATKFYVVR